MTPTKQTIRHNPAIGDYGDCMRACIACLLDKPIEEVPHFAYDGTGAAWERLETYWNKQGYATASMCLTEDVPFIMEMMQHLNPNIYYLLGCASPIADHLVVCRGDQVVCDPGFSATDPPSVENLKAGSGGYVWVTFLTPLNFTNIERTR